MHYSHSIFIYILAWFGGGGGGGGIIRIKGHTLNMHSSMTIQVNGGAKGTSSDSPQWSGEPGNDGKVYTATTCSKQSDCGSNEVCYNWDSGNWVGDHKCYTSNLAYGQTCAADSGVQLSARCASGLCRFSDKKCDHSGDAYVQNGSFEGNALATWTRYTSGGRNGYTVDTSYKNSGSQSIKVTNGGANKWIQLDAPARSTITISGFCKAVGTSTGHPRLEASVYSGKKTSPVLIIHLTNLINVHISCLFKPQQFTLHCS